MNNVLATAKPNKLYRWYSCLSNLVLEARSSNNQVRFYSVFRKNEKCLTKETVKGMFPVGKRIHDQPFLARENGKFFALLNRKNVIQKAIS